MNELTNQMLFELNPTGYFNDVPKDRIIEALGILVPWAMRDPDEPVREVFDKMYSFGLFEMTGGEIDDKGVYRYPEDPDLHPLAVLKRMNGETVYFYQYAMVGVVQPNGDTFVTRMD